MAIISTPLQLFVCLFSIGILFLYLYACAWKEKAYTYLKTKPTFEETKYRIEYLIQSRPVFNCNLKTYETVRNGQNVQTVLKSEAFQEI